MAKKLKKEELELMSYNDIAHMLLKEKPKQMTLIYSLKLQKCQNYQKRQLKTKLEISIQH